MKKLLSLFVAALLSLVVINAQGNPPPQSVNDETPRFTKQQFFIDFGRSDNNNGHHTTSPDALNGYYWNNAFANDGFNVGKNQTLKLTNSSGLDTNIEIETISNFRSNGIHNGALTNPSADLLGEFAVATATEDYFFIESGSESDPGCIDIKNLDPQYGYRFHVFGSRENTESDFIGLFTFTGTNTSSGTHKMGGPNEGGQGIHRNNSNIYVSDIVYPDASGKIRFDITRQTGIRAFINVMKIEELTTEPIIDATSITLSGNNITASGLTSQITATVLPEGATYPAIKWEVSDESIARIDNKGLLYPKTNGKVTVTATITYSADNVITDRIEITISGQLGTVNISGTAFDGDDMEMRMITDRDGTITTDFEIYTTLKGSGNFTLYRDLGNGNRLTYGAGDTPGTLKEGGSPITTTVSGPARINIDLKANTYTILPITTINIVGNSTPTGSDVTKGLALEYKGDGLWSARHYLNSGDPRFNFIINKTSQECLKRVKGTNQVVPQSEGAKYGIAMEDIRTNMNGGEFDIILNLKDYTFQVGCTDTHPLKISYMGSSVASGAGAQSNLGWAYMYTNLLKERYEKGLGLDWKTSNISIGGNTTANLLDRWERDLLSDCSQYVLYGLSLGNEGIHEKGEPAYNSYRDGMLKAIEQAKEAGITPVMANNYTRADFNATDYNFVKKLNLLIHEWDVPSVNTLGAIDDGAGHWANGYENDNAHPNTAGHEEFFYALVPSLFDALEAGKALPKRVSGTSYALGKTVTSNRIELTPENIVHPFTISFDIKTTGNGIIATFENETGNGLFTIDQEGKLLYQSPKKGSIRTAQAVNSGEWQRVTLTHYYAWGVTMLYINKVKAGELYEKLAPRKFVLSDRNAPDEIAFRELFFWRAGMTADEIAYVNDGKMMKSSLEIYAPLGESKDPLANYAQSTNTLRLTNSSLVFDQKIYIDFGKDDGTNGKITTATDDPKNTWNNAVATAAGTQYPLVNSNDLSTGMVMELASNFLSNGINHGGLLAPEAELLGDFAIPTATHDYFFIEENNGAVTGEIDFRNLDPEKAYKFYVFGSRDNASERTGKLTFTGTNSYQGTHRMNSNNSTIFESEAIYPDANGVIRFQLARHVSKFAYINAMKIEEYSVAYSEGASPLISVTPADGLGVRAVRVHSSSGGFNNEGAENLLLDKNIAANKNKKWCYNSKDNWVIFELADYYDLEKFVIDDCRTRENNPNFPEYYIYVSTTGTADADWKEVVHEVGQADVMYKIKEIAPAKARYVKFVPKGIDVVRVFGLQMYGRKSFDSAHPKELISVAKPVIEQQTSPNIQQAAVALFDGNLTADNSRWSTSTGDKYLVVDLRDNYTISEFKLYDARSAGSSEQNIDGYKISISSDLTTWDLAVDVTGKEAANIKTDALSPAKTGRYVKLEIPEAHMGTQKKVTLYEFSIYGSLISAQDDAMLSTLTTSVGTMTPAFDPARANYTLNVAKEVETITLQAAARNEGATLEGDLGEQTLDLGENTFFVTVIAADDITRKTYTLTVNRAEKSTLASLKSLTIGTAELVPVFSPTNYDYRTEVKGITATILAEAGSPDALITGLEDLTLADGANNITITVTSEDGANKAVYNLVVYNTENLISVASPDGKGKRIVNIDSYSAMTHAGENPFRLLRGWRENLSGDNTMKWCDNKTEQPWVIFSLADIYTINHVELRDCKMVEAGWPNIPQYSVYVSTTDTLAGSWTEIVNEYGIATVNEKIKSFDPVDARFVKLVCSKSDAVRIYGFDIYGVYKQAIDRGDILSVGKTIVDCSTSTNDMVTAANLLDGREGTTWEFASGNAYVEIDLEASYQIGKFVLVDSPNWINGYQVSVSNTGNGSDWKLVAEPTFSTKETERKEAILAQPETARYVRLVIPQANQSGSNKLKEFEVHKFVGGSGVEDADASSEEFRVYPNPVAKGAGLRITDTGLVKVYSLGGVLVYQQEVSADETVSTGYLEPGSYIVQLVNEKWTKQVKLIVE